MHTTFRGALGRVNVVVGVFVILIGICAMIAAIVLSIALGTAWYLMLLLPALMAIVSGTFLVWAARRARLEIDAEGFRWAGFAGSEQSVRWEELHQLLPPPPGQRRAVAVAQLRDGRQSRIDAVWESTRAFHWLYGSADHSEEQNALLGTHRAWLARRR